MPGAPSNASMQRPESSAMTYAFFARACTALAFMRAFSSNVLPSSTISGLKPSSFIVETTKGVSLNISAISLALSLFDVARMSLNSSVI